MCNDLTSKRPHQRLDLGPVLRDDIWKKCLVLDLDETLVHSSLSPIENPDMTIPVHIEGTIHNVYVAKRPRVDKFLAEMSKHYEIVVFTASLREYADVLLDRLDFNRVIRHRLYREHCTRCGDEFLKDIGALGRNLSDIVLVDDSEAPHSLYPENGIRCRAFTGDKRDRELDSIRNFLSEIAIVQDVREQLPLWTMKQNMR